MADYSKFSKLIGGVQKHVDMSSQTYVVGDIKVGGASGTPFTKTILDGLIANSHTHSNKTVLDNTTASFTTSDETKLDHISVTQAVDLDTIESASHSHSNKSLLDTYTQLETDLADAVSKKHTHSNSAILDATTASFVTADETKLDFISVTQNVDLDDMESDIATLQGDLADYIPLTQKGAASGVATLDVAGKVPVSQLPNSVMEFKGAWDASTNTPAIADDAVAGEYASHVQEDITWTAVEEGSAGNDIDIIYAPYVGGGSNYVTVSGTEITLHIKLDNRLASTLIGMVSDYPAAAALVAGTLTGTDQDQTYDASFSLTGGVDEIVQANAGDVYRVSVEGTQDLGSGNITFYVGDFAIYSGTIWQRSPMASGVISVNTQTGAVVLDADDISDTSTTNKWATAAEKTKLGHISVTQAVDLDTIESASHSHSNKSLLDTYTQLETDLADAVSKKHAHSNSAVLDATTASFVTADETKLDFISVTQAVDLDTIESASHSHSNKSLLDTYTQLETDLADAVSKKHSHSNSAILDATTASFVTADETKLDFISVTQAVDLDSIESASHSHSNKSLLDTYTQLETDLADAVSKKHAHSNSAILDATTASFVTADETKLDFISITQAVDLDSIESASHSHSNKSLLDTYTQLETDLADAVSKKHSHSNSAVLDATTASFTTADETKLDHISVTQAVDLDQMESDIATLQSGSSLIKKSFVCGESFAANITFSVRLALTGETAGRIYKATSAAASTDGKFWVIGLLMSTSAKSAGDSVEVVMLGSLTLGSSDTAFNAADAGLPVWLTTAGGFSITAPSADDSACVKVGNVQTTSSILINNIQVTGIN